MKLAIILGRGVEGAGVSTFAKELNDYYIDSTVFIYNEKKWQAGNLKIFRNSCIITLLNISQVSKDINTNYDVVLYLSLPPKKNISEEALQAFKKYMIDNVIRPKSFYSQNDHHLQSLNRNSFLDDICTKVDGIFSFSKTSTLFTRYAPNVYDHKYLHLCNGYNFSKNEKFIKDIKHRKTYITYLGRYAKFKNPQNLLALSSDVRIKNTFIVQLLGCAKTIECYHQLLCNNGASRIANGSAYFKLHYVKGDEEMHFPSIPYIYGAYKDKELILDYISTGLFGCSFYNFKNGIDGDNVEYAQLEMISVGLVPLFSEDFAKSKIISRIPIIDYKDCGVYLADDLSNISECCDKLLELNYNRTLAQKYQKNAYDLYRSKYDSKYSFRKMIAKMS
ncbi:MAG: hypothetical protein WC346_21750 [Methanogenium sp.]|jgi:hypothetical protein